MEIRKSTLDDINDIMILYQQARAFMRENKNPNQWRNHYPELFLVESDINQGISYVCIENQNIVGTFMYAQGPDSTYATLYEGKWLNDMPYGVIHRITASRQIKGVATFCVKWCEEQCSNLRIDTHRDNIPMQRFLDKNGFTKCGVIHLEDGDERIVFQKSNNCYKSLEEF